MQHLDVAQKYINLMAYTFSVLLTQSEEDLSLDRATDEYSAIFKSVKERFDEIRNNDVKTLFKTIDSLINEMDSAGLIRKPIYAEAICLCMDKQISYKDNHTIWENGLIYLFDMIPIQNDRPFVFRGSLNSNRKETGVCIIPKFRVSMAETYVDSETKERPLSSRNMLYGINRDLDNVGYYPWQEGVPNVQHIILSDRQLPGIRDSRSQTSIAFSPISDYIHILDTEKKSNTEIGGKSCTGIFINGINEVEMLNEKYAQCWEKSCAVYPEVFFAPEMIATDDMVSVDNLRSRYLKPLLKKVAEAGKIPPRLTVMPTLWRNRENKLLVFDENGKQIGTQYKRKPFVNEKDHSVEALNVPPENTDILLVHLKNKQRIAFAICSEFLIGHDDYVSDFLCKKLGATLVLVPSYSHGEQDFANTINAVKRFGTTVIWGNCCGAVPITDDQPVERIIGACSYAGTDEIQRFGNIKNCDSSCRGVQSCVFCVAIPARVEQNKPDSMTMPEILHLCDRISTK